MSATSKAAVGLSGRLVQIVAIVASGFLFYVVTRAVPLVSGEVSAIAAVGFLLLAGTLLSELVEPLGLPHLTGYLVAGIVAGPNVLHLVDHEAVRVTSQVNALALALIAFSGGAELKLSTVREVWKSLAYSTVIQHLVVFGVSAVAFVAMREHISFARSMAQRPLIGAALLWGVLSASRSPAAVLGVLAQTRASGPVAMRTLAQVMTSDVVVVVLVAAVTAIAKPLLVPGAVLSLHQLSGLGREVLGSVSLGTTLGLLLIVYLRFVGKQVVLVLVALGGGFSEVVSYLHFEPMLTFLCAGFVVQNLSRYGDVLLHAVEDLGSVVYVVFFATAGAHLDLGLLAQLWPVALAFCGIRAVTTFACAHLASHLANDPPEAKKYGFSGLVSQAGLTLGIAAILQRQFPDLGAPFSALVVACVALNEMVGPILFKWGLDRAGEAKPREA